MSMLRFARGQKVCFTQNKSELYRSFHQLCCVMHCYVRSWYTYSATFTHQWLARCSHYLAVKHTREGKDICEHLFNTSFPSAEVQISCLAYKTKKHLKQLENSEVNQREFIRTAATSINPPQKKLKNAQQNNLGKSMQCYMEQMQFYCNAGRHSEEHRKKKVDSCFMQLGTYYELNTCAFRCQK